MKARTTILLSLALPALWAFSTPADRMSFAPETGTTLLKSFTTTVELSLDEMAMAMNGEEQDMSMLGMEMTMTNISELEFVDTYDRMAEGRPGQVTRVYETLGNNASTSQSNQMMGSMDMDIPSSSELEGETVIFSWDEDEEEYTAAFPEDSDSDEELLTGLVEDTDLRGFLPEGDVAEGDTWEVDADYLINLMAPGGDVKLLPEEMDELGGIGADPLSGMSFQDMLGELEGEVTCEYKGIREGRALIEVAIEVSSNNDLTELIATAMEAAEVDTMGAEVDFESVEVDMEMEGEGTLTWDLEAGHFTSFELSGDMEQVMDMAMAMSIPGMGDMEMEQTITMSGNLNFEFEASEE